MHQAANRRDPLTGEPIRPDLPVLSWEIPAHRLPRKYLEPDHDVIVAPIKMHTNRPTRVGPAYAFLLAQFIAASEWEDQVERTEAERDEDLCWWQSEYGLRLVRKRLLEFHRLDTVLYVLEAITTMHEGRLDADVVAERFSRSTDWVLHFFKRCNNMARSHRRYCPCEYCEADRAKYRGERAS